jgi:hypothetical protein
LTRSTKKRRPRATAVAPDSGRGKNFSAEGSPQALEKAKIGEGTPRKSKSFFFAWLCSALLDLAGFAGFWVRLGKAAAFT